jgi:hypothetical protein
MRNKAQERRRAAERKRAQEICAPYRQQISDTPMLLSILYDIDMLPEQTVTVPGAIRLAAFCEIFKKLPPGTTF